MKQYEKMLQHYPGFISKEQFYKICHISKNTALKLFQSGLVPVIDTNRKTCRYFIAKKDVITYLKERELNPQKYHFSRRTWTQSYSTIDDFNDKLSKQIKIYVSDQWRKEADVLSVADLNRLLGYQTSTIRKWLTNGHLKFIKMGSIYYIPKSHAITFISSATFYALPRKSDFHINMIKECSICIHKQSLSATPRVVSEKQLPQSILALD